MSRYTIFSGAARIQSSEKKLSLRCLSFNFSADDDFFFVFAALKLILIKALRLFRLLHCLTSTQLVNYSCDRVGRPGNISGFLECFKKVEKCMTWKCYTITALFARVV